MKRKYSAEQRNAVEQCLGPACWICDEWTHAQRYCPSCGVEQPIRYQRAPVVEPSRYEPAGAFDIVVAALLGAPLWAAVIYTVAHWTRGLR